MFSFVKSSDASGKIRRFKSVEPNDIFRQETDPQMSLFNNIRKFIFDIWKYATKIIFSFIAKQFNII